MSKMSFNFLFYIFMLQTKKETTQDIYFYFCSANQLFSSFLDSSDLLSFGSSFLSTQINLCLSQSTQFGLKTKERQGKWRYATNGKKRRFKLTDLTTSKTNKTQQPHK